MSAPNERPSCQPVYGGTGKCRPGSSAKAERDELILRAEIRRGDPADAFDLVIPSIPGYGFSGPTVDTGWDSARTAGAWDELMKRLRYERYGAHGGDAGALITRELGILNFGAFFVVVGVTSLLARPLLGRLSDIIGRDLSVVTGFGLQLISLLLISTVSNLVGMIVCGALYMLGNAIGSSTTLAIAVERADPRRHRSRLTR